MAATSTEILQFRQPERPDTLSKTAMQVLEVVADAERNLSVCTTRRIARTIRQSQFELYRFVRPLVTEGYLDAQAGSVTTELNRYVLTARGWELVGGKPMWME